MSEVPRTEKFGNLLRELAAEFLARNAGRESMITVTGARVSPDLKRGTVLISVLPTKDEENALGFCKRRRSEFRDFMKKNLKTKVIPFIDFEIDYGEKNRQKIDELLKNK